MCTRQPFQKSSASERGISSLFYATRMTDGGRHWFTAATAALGWSQATIFSLVKVI
jgi:hypothetical protein